MVDKLNLINEIPNVNCGGCGQVARQLYYHILRDKNPHKKLQIYYVVHNKDTEGIRAVRMGTPRAPSHVVLKYGKDFVDSRGIMDMPNLKWFWGSHQLHRVSIDYLEESLKAPTNGWNPRFDKKYVKTIKKILEPKLSIRDRLKGLLWLPKPFPKT